MAWSATIPVRRAWALILAVAPACGAAQPGAVERYAPIGTARGLVGPERPSAFAWYRKQAPWVLTELLAKARRDFMLRVAPPEPEPPCPPGRHCPRPPRTVVG